MFISNNTIVTTDKGNVLANSKYDKLFSVNGFVTHQFVTENKKSYFIKTDIFPTLTVGEEVQLLTGKIESSNNEIYIQNNFSIPEKIREGDYLFVPKIPYNQEIGFNRTLLWLYAKYIVGGYYCIEKQTNKPTIIIKLKRFSKKEAVKLRKYEDITYDLNNKTIVIQNIDIINEFGKYKKNLNKKVYGCDKNLVKFFIHSMFIENDNKIILEHKSMAYDIFMFVYNKLDRVFRIVEFKENNKKYFSITDAEKREYILIQEQLYVRVNKVLDGKSVKGLSMQNNENNMFCIGFTIAK